MTVTFSSSDSDLPAPPAEIALAAEPGDSAGGIIRLKRRRMRRSAAADSGVCVILLGPDAPRGRTTKAERWTKIVVDHVTTAGAAPRAGEGDSTATVRDPTRWYAFDAENEGIHRAI
jgi:hypothetical protein